MVQKKHAPKRNMLAILRKMRDSNPRYPEGGIPDFESGAFGHSANLPYLQCKSNTFQRTIQNYSKESLFNLFLNCSASLLRIDSVMLHVLSNIWSMIRGFISFTMRITSFIMG